MRWWYLLKTLWGFLMPYSGAVLAKPFVFPKSTRRGMEKQFSIFMRHGKPLDNKVYYC